MSRDREHAELLELLGAALTPPSAEPSPGELESLRRAVRGEVEVSTVPFRPVRRGRRLVVLAVAALVLLVGAVVIRAVGSDPDREVGTAAPVPATPLARAEASLEDLRDAIATADPAQITPALAVAEETLTRLSPAERAELEPDATRLLDAARRIVAPPATPPTTPPTTVDDKGGERNRDRTDDRSGSNSGSG